MKPEEIFGKIIKEIRNQQGISQEELSDRTGLDRSYLSQIENGKKSPSLSTILRISRALNLKTSELLLKFEEHNQ